MTSEQCSSVMLQIAHQALRCQVYKHFLIQALFRNKPNHPFNNIVLEHEHWAALGMNRTPSTKHKFNSLQYSLLLQELKYTECQTSENDSKASQQLSGKRSSNKTEYLVKICEIISLNRS